MDERERQRLYDELVEFENTHQPGQRVWSEFWGMYNEALWDHCESPEEVLASHLTSSFAWTDPKKTDRFPHFVAVRWPWGDARELLRAGGRTPYEARLRLRDKLVESARNLINERSAAAPAPREEES